MLKKHLAESKVKNPTTIRALWRQEKQLFYDLVELPAYWNIKESLLACPRHPASFGMARQGGECLQQQQVRCHWAPREFSQAEQPVPGRAAPAAIEAAVSLVLVTDWQPCRLERWSHGKDAESGGARPCALTSSPHVSGAHAAAARQVSLWLLSAASQRAALSLQENIQTSLSQTGFKKSNAFFFSQRGNSAFLLLSFSEVVLSCSFLQLQGRKLPKEGRDHMIPGAEVWREKEICCKTQVTGQAGNLEVLKHTLHAVPGLLKCQILNLAQLEGKLNKQGPKHKLRTYSKAYCAPEKNSHGLNDKSGLSQTGLIVKFTVTLPNIKIPCPLVGGTWYCLPLS